ncbi:hypothetical protein E5288_WYG012126 [Bos mutus]|uniref:Uncharacterized protein n=1 Tax=Bos mutus TaxID=72004 RepID=A0A6B0R3C1_9CETA|nr:hypothetical protein [Bos mutus]
MVTASSTPPGSGAVEDVEKERDGCNDELKMDAMCIYSPLEDKHLSTLLCMQGQQGDPGGGGERTICDRVKGVLEVGHGHSGKVLEKAKTPGDARSSKRQNCLHMASGPPDTETKDASEASWAPGPQASQKRSFRGHMP